MNKKANTIVFMLVATVLNVGLMVGIFGILTVLDLLLLAPRISPQANQFVFIIIIIITMALTFFLYHRIIKWLTKKWNLEERLGPIFGNRKKGPE